MPSVLVVDDDIDISEALQQALEYGGYDTSAAFTGAEALAAVRGHVPDLVLLDQMLPDIDGAEVCRRLRGAPETRRVPIVFLTARADEGARIRGLALGADDYVTKPFSLDELLLRIQAVLRRAHPDELRVTPEWLRLREQLRVWTGYAELHFQRAEWRDCVEVSRSILRDCDRVLSPEERARANERLARAARALGDHSGPQRDPQAPDRLG
jgi:two-component system phosphate regulon response regulator PhoB